MLYLPRLAVLVRIEAIYLPGPLGPCLCWFPAIYLSRDFDLVKVPGNPMKSPFGFGPYRRRSTQSRSSQVQVDWNLMLYLPRLAVLVTIVADRPGAWFPGPLGPYQAWFPGIGA